MYFLSSELGFECVDILHMHNLACGPVRQSDWRSGIEMCGHPSPVEDQYTFVQVNWDLIASRKARARLSDE